MFTVTFLNVTIAAKIQRLKIFVHPVAIGKKSEKAVCNFLLNVKNVILHGCFTPIPRHLRKRRYQINNPFLYLLLLFEFGIAEYSINWGFLKKQEKHTSNGF